MAVDGFCISVFVGNEMFLANGSGMPGSLSGSWGAEVKKSLSVGACGSERGGYSGTATTFCGGFSGTNVLSSLFKLSEMPFRAAPPAAPAC